MRKNSKLFVCLTLLLGIVVFINTGAKGCTGALQQNDSTGNSFVAEAPYNLTVTATSSSQVVLTWQEDALYEQGTRVQRKAGSTGSYVTITNLGPNVHIYTDTGVAPATSYYYRTQNFYTASESEYSNEASITTPDTGWDSPFTLSATANSATAISISWSDNFSAEQGFLIERKTGSSGTYAQITISPVAANITTCTDTTVFQSTTYYYRVKADYSTSSGIYSNEAYARTPGITADLWTALTTTGAPTARIGHTAVWADGYGSIVYGGDFLRNGSIYSPTANAWSAMTAVGVPSARVGNTAVWTGTEMLVWGGELAARWTIEYSDPPTNTIPSVYSWTTFNGSSYNPGTNSWTAMSSANAPGDRTNHTAVWTGNRMIVWGGEQIRQDATSGDFTRSTLNTGGVYDPNTDSWSSEFPNLANGIGAPAARCLHSSVWTGGAMIVWGGKSGTAAVGGGGIYNLATDLWIPQMTSSGAPAARYDHSTVWTGAGSNPWNNKMIVWGGTDGSQFFNTGGTYDPVANSWTALPTTDAPTARTLHSTAWTGSKMIVWGGGCGVLQGAFDTGGVYDPATNTWMPTPSANVPTARTMHTAVWDSGNGLMLIWGGWDSLNTFNTGASYKP
ncbi:MAG: hypothetical protein V1701_01950 [Planctomycetota bacterium]